MEKIPWVNLMPKVIKECSWDIQVKARRQNQTNGGMIDHLNDLGMTQPKTPEENQSDEDGT
ncbi:hypothetical protein KY290_024959 [Solanum tuberosum]|uniref:Uncharacterized protein n=1 Tax=Solanum tuberosum TaxID=4113 RepID=A0ABQ7UU07_SOLTU|nr:hypothetical protein KY284_023817 [Solanum tuberosum]KAH0754689.1 hypothetical protein KY290_024959 [Solanum tuberosum]